MRSNELKTVLVDSSIWIRFLQKKPFDREEELRQLILSGRAGVCQPVEAEILSGAKSDQEFLKFKDYFAGFFHATPPEDIWDQIAVLRFKLARKGVSVSIVDLWIALTALHNNIEVWSDDGGFPLIAKEVALKIYS